MNDHPRVGHALVEVAEATRQVVGDHIDLALLRVKGTLVRFSLVLVAALALLGGWIVSCFSIGALIASHSSSMVALAAIGVFHLLGGLVLLVMARSRRGRHG